MTLERWNCAFQSMNDGEEFGLTLAVLVAQPRHERAIKF